MAHLYDNSSPSPSFIIYDEKYGLFDQSSDNVSVSHDTEKSPLAVISAPDQEHHRPPKTRRHGEKILSILRSLRNSTSTSSPKESSTSSPASGLSHNQDEHRRCRSKAVLLLNLEPTVIRRNDVKSRPDFTPHVKRIFEGGLLISPTATDSSTPSQNNAQQADKKLACVPSTGCSTETTSIDTKLSRESPQNALSKNVEVFENGRNRSVIGSPDPIEENPGMKTSPTIVTVENASSAKIFFECHYNGILNLQPSQRTLRLRELECLMYDNPSLSLSDQDDIRRLWARNESHHLRELRVMKSRGLKALTGEISSASKYKVVKVLGKGSFGVVRLVREISDNNVTQLDVKSKEVFAMKVIRKSNMLRSSQEGHLRAERDFLVRAEGSRWVIPLIASFQDVNCLYLVMEYMPGGDFLGLLIRDNVLAETVTKFYVAEMVLCIEEAHNLRWIHRDIKPDNFLLTASGHLKISDFGLAFDGHWSHDQNYYNNHRYSLLTTLGIKIDGDSIDRKESRTIGAALQIAQAIMGVRERHEVSQGNQTKTEGVLNWRNRTGNRALAKSVVGTSQYMAPEVIRGESYDARCDWWSLGIIIYECLYGHTPFLADEGGRQATKVNILNHKYSFSFPSRSLISTSCQDLIRRMIQEKGERLCSKRYQCRDLTTAVTRRYQDYTGRFVFPNDAEDIKAHRWFHDVEFSSIHEQTPPFVPTIQAPDDTSYFDEGSSISDFAPSEASIPPPSPADVDMALRPFNRDIQVLAKSFISSPYDTYTLKKVEREIENLELTDEQKEYLSSFIKCYGRKERKRPRDRMLRDVKLRGKVLDLRKKGAFLGYTYRRISKEGQQDICNKLANQKRGNDGRGKIAVRGVVGNSVAREDDRDLRQLTVRMQSD